MKLEQPPLLGILGGMGPLATVDFLGKLTRALPASRDQDHLPWITVSQPGMPDRSQAIRNGDNGPETYLVKAVSYLAAQGVKLIAVPCSTSHFWFDRMQAASTAPIMHIADAAVEELRNGAARNANRVAVLATRGTVQSGIYTVRLQAAGFKVFELGETDQTAVDGMIRDVKAGNIEEARKAMRLMQDSLSKRGVEASVLGCTELPLAHGDADAVMLSIDVSLALARASLKKLGYAVREAGAA